MAKRTGRFTLVQQNDLHAQLEPHAELFRRRHGDEYRTVGGLANAAAMVAAMRAEGQPTLLVDCGDAIHGTLPAVRTEGRAIVPALRAEGVDVIVPGNWEYAFGPAALRERMEELGSVVLAENLRRAEDGRTEYPGTEVRELGRLRVGFLGLTSPIVPSISPRFAGGLWFLDARDVLPRAVERLRDEESCDVVVLVSHLGFAQDATLLREVDGVDLCLSGHTHNRLHRPVRVGGCLVIQSGYSGSFLGRLDISVESGRVVDARHRLMPVETAGRADAVVAERVDAALAPFREEMGEVLGRTEVGLHRNGLLETSMDNLIVDAYREATGAPIALSHGWRFAPPVPPGSVTVGDVWAMVPTNPPLEVVTLTGAQIWRFLERNLENVFAADPLRQAGGYVVRASGLTVVFRPNNPAGTRVEQVMAGDAALEQDTQYQVAVAGMRGLPDTPEPRATHMTAIDAVAAYLQRRSSVSPVVTGRTFIAQ